MGDVEVDASNEVGEGLSLLETSGEELGISVESRTSLPLHKDTL